EGDMDSWMDAVGLGCLPTGAWRKANGTGSSRAADSGDSRLFAPPRYSRGEHLSSTLGEVDEVCRHWGPDGGLWDEAGVASPAADGSFAGAIALLSIVYDGGGPEREQPSLSKARKNRLPGVP